MTLEGTNGLSGTVTLETGGAGSKLSFDPSMDAPTNRLEFAMGVEEGGVLNSTTGEGSNRSMLIGTYPGGDAYTHEFVINGGTVSTPYGFIGVGWQATHASMTLNSGLVSAKGLMMRATTVGGDGNISTAHTEKMTQNGGTLEIGSLGIGGYAATKTPTLAFNAGTLKATVVNFDEGYFLMQAEMPGLLGTTTVAKGATLTNVAAEACPIFGTLAGAGNLAGKFTFGEQSTWAIGIRRARLTSCVDTTGVTNTDYLQLLRTIDVTVEELSTKAKYELGPAGDLTAEDAAKIAVTVTLDGADVPGWTATVEDGELKLVNPKPVLGSTILLR